MTTVQQNENQTWPSYYVPIIKANEVVVTDRILGSGGFCDVSPVRSIDMNVDTDTKMNMNIQPKEEHEPNQNQNQNQIQMDESAKMNMKGAAARDRIRFAKQFKDYYEKHYKHKQIVVPGHFEPEIDPFALAQKPPRIALKRVRSSLRKERYRIGVKDLAAEAKVLAKCSHPNIISLYAVGRDDDTGSHDNDDSDDRIPEQITFVIIDQLRSTLRNKLHKWNDDKGLGLGSGFGFGFGFGFMTTKKQSKRFQDLWLERLVVIHKIADAIGYLHSRGIIHRDINPDNVGFTDDGTVKLFDFGLVKCVGRENQVVTNNNTREVIDDDSNAHLGSTSDKHENELFDLTSMTGTIRYMSPEVALGQPYGFKVDVYSLSIVIHEILSLNKPYIAIQDIDSFNREVMRGGQRPPLDESWPPMIQDLLRRMWSSDSMERPSSREVVGILGQILRGDDCDLFPSARGSRSRSSRSRG